MLLYLVSNCGTILIDMSLATLLVSRYGYNGLYIATLISAPVGLILSNAMVKIAEGNAFIPCLCLEHNERHVEKSEE